MVKRRSTDYPYEFEKSPIHVYSLPEIQKYAG
jgi:hypothetical protein